MVAEDQEWSVRTAEGRRLTMQIMEERQAARAAARKSKPGIDHFTKAEFEDALPRHKETGAPLCVCVGIVNGEYVYQLPVGGENSKVIIEIRSSVGANGLSASSGENSIRAYLMWFDKAADVWKPLGSKAQKYVTRLPGWAERLTEMLRTLYGWRKAAGNCPKCGKPKGIFKVTNLNNYNRGRVYAKCLEHNEFRWLTEAKEETK